MSEHWIETAIIYQIYPRSFYDSNGDGIGDLKGIIAKLDYLAGSSNSLGVTAIWLSPIYPSPMKDFGYDVSDYKNIDPIFGTLDDFDELVTQAHQRNIKVILDYIPNHTSSAHPWFQESKKSRDNPKRDWYVWQDPKPDGSPPNNWLSVFGGSAWEFDEQTGQYYYHAFDVDQPDLNWRNPDVVAEMLDVLHFWMKRGVDGFRVDAYDFLFEDTRLLDEEVNQTYIRGQHGPHDELVHAHTFAQPESLAMLQVIAATLGEYKDKFMVTEVYSDIDGLSLMYQQVNKRWYAPFNFGLILSPWKADVHKTLVNEIDFKVGHNFLPTWVVGNHDQPRLASRIGRDQARNGAMLLMTLRGIPFIYYGDEIGMTNVPIPIEKVVDTFEKNSPGLGLGRDPERTPMQWDANTHSGFSKTDPWLPLAEDFKQWNVLSQQQDGKSLFSLYKALIASRKKHTCLTNGAYHSLNLEHDSIFAFTRENQEQTILVVLNYADTAQSIELPFTKGTLLFNSQMTHSGVELNDFAPLEIPAHDGYLIEIHKG